MEIEVNEYVRTYNGLIGKVVQITGAGNYVIRIYNGAEYAVRAVISKHSKNIIDLIEIGDYVNGYKVVYIAGHYISVESDDNYDLCFEEQDIKSIVTHERFASIEYKVEEDK